jgi:hypothetical protein
MTEDMNDIARQTKIETVSMKVITLVTLFFLPGTFTSVGRIFLPVSPFLSSTTMIPTLAYIVVRYKSRPCLKLTAHITLLRRS